MRTYPKSLYYTNDEQNVQLKDYFYRVTNLTLVLIFVGVLGNFVAAIRLHSIVPGGTPLVMVLATILIGVLLAFWYSQGMRLGGIVALTLLNVMFMSEVSHVNMWNNFQERPTITHDQAKRLYTKAGNLNIFAKVSDVTLINKYPTKILNSTSEMNSLLNSNEPVMFVFFKVGCPYCERAHQPIVNQAKATNNSDKVIFVNYESEIGHTLEAKFNVDKVTTLITKDSNKNWYTTSQSVYKDGVRQLTPDTKGIKSAFATLK